MKYKFEMTLEISAPEPTLAGLEEAKERAQNTLAQLRDTLGHAPFSVSVSLDSEEPYSIEEEDD